MGGQIDVRVASVDPAWTTGTRTLCSLFLERFDDWPVELSLPSAHFALFVAADAANALTENVLTFARRAVRSGAAYVCAWGPGCKRVHDVFDDVRREEEDSGRIPPTDEASITTDWHDEETLDDALWFFVRNALPSDDYWATCLTWLAVTVGSQAWAEHIHARLTDPETLDEIVLAEEP